VDESCPEGYDYLGTCSDGDAFCIHGGLPPGTDTVFASDCPEGTTARGGWYCSDYTVVLLSFEIVLRRQDFPPRRQ
jgi:hypothetical protein